MKKWEKEFDIRLEYDVGANNKVNRLHCTDCKRWESRITSMKNFNEMWIRPGSSNVEKDSVKKHINSLPHKKAIRIAKQSKLGAL